MPAPTQQRAAMQTEVLLCGDNLDLLRALPDRCIDLVAIDPPFNSNRAYAHYDDRHGSSGAYVAFLAPRLRELARVLIPTGSLYCHCDHHAGHLLRLLLDGLLRFRSEIIWRRTNAKGLAFRGYPTNHDTILYYTAGDRFTFHRPYCALDEEYVRRFYRHVEPATGRRYRLSDLTNPNPDRPNLTYEWNGHVRVWRWTRERMAEAHRRGLIHYTKTGLACQKRYLDEMKGRPVDTVWDDIAPVGAQAAERLGYPTQKPLSLLERIVAASSNPGDVVLDAFCGSGTALVAAQRLGRRWIGMDAAPAAVALAARRLEETCGLRAGRDCHVRDAE
jgi:site-specific DNA-methyltransferase (adenine-specific)